MEACHIDRFGSVDGIVLRSSDDSPAGTEKRSLMRVRASALNYRDLMVLKASVAVRQSSASCR